MVGTGFGRGGKGVATTAAVGTDFGRDSAAGFFGGTFGATEAGGGTEILAKLGTGLGGGMLGEVGGACRLSGGIPSAKTVFEKSAADWWS